MKYKSCVFAVYANNKKPIVANNFYILFHSIFFVYDNDACICFAVLNEKVNENEIKKNIPIYEKYIIDTEKYIKYYGNLQIEIDCLNGKKEKMKIVKTSNSLEEIL